MCKHCTEALKIQNTLQHDYLVAITREENEQHIDCMFYCFECQSILHGKFDNVRFETLSLALSNEPIEKYRYHISVAEHCAKQMKLWEQRIDFVGRKHIVGYIPIFEEEYDELKLIQLQKEADASPKSSKVVPLFDYVEASLEEMDEDEEGETFVLEPDLVLYPEPLDYMLSDLSPEVPRYYLLYKVPASDYVPVWYVLPGGAPSTTLCTYSASYLSIPQVIDVATGKTMSCDEFVQNVARESIWQPFKFRL